MATMMQQRVNAITGKCEWVVISQDEQDDHDRDDAVIQALVTTSYLDMLNDSTRNKAFHNAIRKLVRNPSCHHVLDIGAGTGLLSMMTYRAKTLGGNDSFNVTACESYLPMYQLAGKILKQNNMDSNIRLFNMRSDKMKVGVQLPSQADALVCEILDSELIGEGVIPTLRHAHQHLLKPDASVVPYRATVYAQLVESDLLWKCHDLKNVESELADGLVLVPPDHDESYFNFSQHAMHVDAFSKDLKTLSEPFEAFTVEFHRAPDSHGNFKRPVNISKDGTAHGIISWWVLQLDEEGLIYYSTAPKQVSNSTSGKSWNDHWRQCVWFLPGRGIPVKSNSCIDVAVEHDETSVQYFLGSRPSVTKEPGLKMTQSRIRMLGDPQRRSVVRAAVSKAIGGRRSAKCLVIDDSLLTAVAAAANQNTQVCTMFPAYKDEGLKYLKAVADVNKFETENIFWVQKKLTQLTPDDVKDVDVILAEPYYCNYENMLPWKQLRFWHELSVLQPLLGRKCTVMPCRGTLCGMGFSLPDLWKSRCSLNKVEGFDHTLANKFLGACGNLPEFLESPMLTFPLWQCGQHEAVTNRFTLITFDMSKQIQNMSGAATVHFTNVGLCHGVVLWMEWAMDSEDTLVLSTGPSEESKPDNFKQGYYLLKSPIEIRRLMNCLQVEATFDAQSGEVNIEVLDLQSM